MEETNQEQGKTIVEAKFKKASKKRPALIISGSILLLVGLLSFFAGVAVVIVELVNGGFYYGIVYLAFSFPAILIGFCLLAFGLFGRMRNQDTLGIDNFNLTDQEFEEKWKKEEASQTVSLQPTPCLSGKTFKCPLCGKENPVEADSCSNCGVSFSPEAKFTICPKCGERNDKGADFCTKCGNSLK